MDPQNIVEMSRAVSAVSATMGSPDSLHRRFQPKAEINQNVQADMIYRLKKRADQEEVIAYDPEDPASMLQEQAPNLNAIIDGAGAFKNAGQAAQVLKNHNPSLEQVGYHREDDTIAFAGHPTGDLNKTGFFFSQSHTRGQIFLLHPTRRR